MFFLFEFAVQRPFGNLISLNEPSVYKRQIKFLNISVEGMLCVHLASLTVNNKGE